LELGDFRNDQTPTRGIKILVFTKDLLEGCQKLDLGYSEQQPEQQPKQQPEQQQ
jgi:hypothetical protein